MLVEYLLITKKVLETLSSLDTIQLIMTAAEPVMVHVCPWLILDVGCGEGSLINIPDATIIGVDVDESALDRGRIKHPGRIFLCGSGEKLPFPDSYFQMVRAHLSLPYMNIRKALREFNRVLVPGGAIHLSLHSFRAVCDFRNQGRLGSRLLYFPYIVLNGLAFHFGLPQFHFLWTRRIESFQSERGMLLALSCSGFGDVRFERDGVSFRATASKSH